MSSSPESALLAVYQQYSRSGLGGDLRFVDAVFTLLRKHTTLLNTDSSIAQVQKLAIKHCEIGKKERAEKKQTTTQPKPSSRQSTCQSTEQSNSQSSSQTNSESTNQSTTESTAESSSQSSNQSEPPVTSHQPTGAVPVNNGGTTSRYTWSQTLGDVTCILSTKLPASMTAKQLTVDIDTNRLNVVNKSNNEVLVSGELNARILADDATWTLELDSAKQAKILSLYLPKMDRMQWWPCLIKGDESIDVTKIEPENSQLSDLDTDTRQTVEKMMFDQRAKQTGQKTSDEITKEQALKRFMELHPEMDFSQAKIM